MRAFYRQRPNLTFVIGDVRDRRSVDDAMHGIDVVFHAAALKQVPNCEYFPLEAIRTNVLGMENLVEAAIATQVETFIALSTDKAVKPVNVMGMTKAFSRLDLRASATGTSCALAAPWCRSSGVSSPSGNG